MMKLWVTHNGFEANPPARCVDTGDFKDASCLVCGFFLCPKIPTNSYFGQYHVI